MELELIADHLSDVRQYQGYVAALCPFHSDHKPSLLVFENDYFSCQACGRSGSHDQLYQALTNAHAKRRISSAPVSWKIPYLPANLEEMQNLAWSCHNILLKHPDLGWYLESRGLGDMIGRAALGWYNGWYTIPIFNQDEPKKPAGLYMRAGPHIQKASGLRFAQPKGQKGMLYVPDWGLLARRNTLVVPFGVFDALTVADLGFASATSINGKDSFDPTWFDFWRGRIVVIPDEGEEESAMKLASQLSWRGEVFRPLYPDGAKDLNDMVQAGRGKDLEKMLARYN